MFPWENGGFETTLATLATTHQGPRQRTRRRSTCRHGHAWIGRKAKGTGPICEKPWENQGFTRGEYRNRTFSCFPCSFEEFERWENPSDPKNIAPNGQCLLFYGTVGAETSLDTSLGCRVVGATDWGSYFRAGSVIVFRSLDLMSATIFSRSFPNCAASSRLILRISSLIESVVIF